MEVNAAWLSNMDEAVDHLSSQCPESDALNLRRDADTIHSLSADISTHLQQLIQSTSDTDTTEVSLRPHSQ